uniref:R2r3-myb transcription factor n=1 Tax=Rhizophora mucronata TaxID=61149 RepID=A0A2P2PQE6_RHIMU
MHLCWYAPFRNKEICPCFAASLSFWVIYYFYFTYGLTIIEASSGVLRRKERN